MRRSWLVSILFFFSFMSNIKGQDPHFSQYFSSPLTLNPAMTGYFNADYRFSTNFRQQWTALSSPFITSTFSYDTKMLQTKVTENDVLSLGLLGLYDQSLSGGFKNINLAVSLAYHKAIDPDGVHNIGAGFQATYAARSIDMNRLDFANQFNGSGFDTNIPSYESFSNTHKNYFDINTGLLYTYKTEDIEFYVGGSLYHVGRPNTSFLQNENFRLPIRYTVHAGSRFVLGYNSNELFIGGLYMSQAGATEKNIGIAYGINVSNAVKLYAGTWYRIGDAILPFIGFNFNNVELGISYDITNSSLKRFIPKNNSLELSLNILVTKPRNVYTNYKGGRIF